MKKFVALLLSLLLALGAVSAMAEGKVKLTLGIWPEDVDTSGLAAHENDFLPAFQAAMPDVEVEKAHYKYAVDTFISMAEAGTVPTVFETWYTEPQKLIAGGFVADITAELNELGWLDKMNPVVRAILSDKDGKVYGLPRDSYALGLMINAQVFEDAGLVDENGIPKYPKTWDEFIEVGKTIKEKTGSAALCLLAADNAGGWHFSNIAWTFGAVLENQTAEGKWEANLNSPEAVAAMSFVKDLKWKHDLLTSDPTTENWGTGFAQLGTGAAAMYIGANDAVNMPTAQNGLPVDKLMLVAIPAGNGDKSYTLSGGTPYMFAKGATHEQILAGLKYLECMGRAPLLTDAAKLGMESDAKTRVEQGIPVINLPVPAWADDEYNAFRESIVAKYKNVDDRMFESYFGLLKVEGAIRTEEPAETQEMYSELTKVLQAVVTDEKADVQALLDTADANLQAHLDKTVNK